MVTGGGQGEGSIERMTALPYSARTVCGRPGMTATGKEKGRGRRKRPRERETERERDRTVKGEQKKEQRRESKRNGKTQRQNSERKERDGDRTAKGEQPITTPPALLGEVVGEMGVGVKAMSMETQRNSLFVAED